MSLLLDALKGAEDSRKATGQDAGEPVDVIDSKVELEFSLELDQVDDQDQVVEVKGIESEEINNEKNIHSDSGVGNMPELHKVGMPEGGSDDFGNKIQNEANSDEGGVEKNKITDEHNIAEAVFRNRNGKSAQFSRVIMSACLLCVCMLAAGYYWMIKNEAYVGINNSHSNKNPESTIVGVSSFVEQDGVDARIMLGDRQSNSLNDTSYVKSNESAVVEAVAATASNKPIINMNDKELPIEIDGAVRTTVEKIKVVDDRSEQEFENSLEKKIPNKILSSISIHKRQVPNQIKINLSKGRQAVAEGDLRFAERIFNKVLAESPKNIEALLYMADIMNVYGKKDSARSLYLTALEESPGNLKASVGLLNLASNKTSLNQGSNLKKLIIDNPNKAFLHANLGDYYVGRSEWPAAQAAYFEAFAQNPDNSNYAFNLAVCLDQLGKSDIALRYYKKALELNKSNKSRFDKDSALARIQVLTGVMQ